MARFYDKIGYGEAVETPSGSGVYVDQITERFYYGDIVRDTQRFQQTDRVNDNLTLGHMISIVADEYADNHVFAIRYVRMAGALWKVQTVEVKSPRLILYLGDVYNGPVPEEEI